jgi:hypothetical protein
MGVKVGVRRVHAVHEVGQASRQLNVSEPSPQVSSARKAASADRLIVSRWRRADKVKVAVRIPCRMAEENLDHPHATLFAHTTSTDANALGLGFEPNLNTLSVKR